MRPDSGDVLVTGANGGVGSVAVALLASLGYRVVASTGRLDETDYLKSLGAAQVLLRSEIDYGKRPMESVRWAGAVDNVGGEMLDTLLLHMAPLGRILICGAMSSGYTDVKMEQGPRNYMRICTNQLTVQGFLLLFYRDQLAEGAKQMAQWVAEGKLYVEENIVEGFEHAPSLLPTMFTGKRPGKLLLKVADPV